MRQFLAAAWGLIFATSAFSNPIFSNYASRTEQLITANLRACGLNLVTPGTAPSPFPRRDATYAVYNRLGQHLAYFHQEFGPGYANWRWMNPNGSYAHSIQFSAERIRYVTPLAGNVVSASDYVTPYGRGYNLYCRAFGNVTSWEVWESCVQRDFIETITRQLCR